MTVSLMKLYIAKILKIFLEWCYLCQKRAFGSQSVFLIRTHLPAMVTNQLLPQCQAEALVITEFRTRQEIKAKLLTKSNIYMPVPLDCQRDESQMMLPLRQDLPYGKKMVSA